MQNPHGRLLVVGIVLLAASVGVAKVGVNITEFPTLTANSRPLGITTGPDGALWFIENGASKIGRITTAGVVTEFPVLSANPQLQNITTGPDGALWFTEYAGNKIGRITTAGVVTEFPIPTAGSNPSASRRVRTARCGSPNPAQPDRAHHDRRCDYRVPDPNGQQPPGGITAGPDGALWFTEQTANKIGRITTAGVITEFPIPTANSLPRVSPRDRTARCGSPNRPPTRSGASRLLV